MAAVFSVNQVHQLYVAKSYDTTVDETTPVGRIGAIKTTGTCYNNKEVMFFYKGADNVLRSDRIQVRNIDYVKKLAPVDMRTPLKVVEVTLDENVNSGAPVAGQDYVLRINFRQFYGMSDEDQYIKDAVVRATSSDTAATLLTKMKDALNLAFSREVGATKTSNPYLDFDFEGAAGSGSSATPDKLVITEKAQGFTLGLESQERVYFDIIPTTVYDGTDDVIWGKATDATPARTSATSGQYIGNGPKIAELEYFCMGERGDQYRMAGWPNYIPTTYLADATQEYYVMEIHYGFTDTGVNSYRSEKDITVVSTNSQVLEDFYNDFIKAAGINDVEALKQDVADLQEAAEDDDNG